MNILIAFIDNLIWSYFEILTKKISDKVSPRDALWLHLYFIPLGVFWALLAYFLHPVSLTNQFLPYSICILSFALIVLIENYLTFHLYTILSTSSFFKLQLGISIFLNLLLDYFVFHLIPSPLMLIAGWFFAFSGYLLNTSTKTVSTFNGKALFWMIIMTLCAVMAGFVMKKYTTYSTNDFVNLFIIQIATWAVIGWFGYKNLSKISKIPEIYYTKYLYALVVFIGVIFEFFVFKNLSLFIISMLTNTRFLIYLIYDHHTKQLQLNRRTIYGVTVGVVGTIIVAFSTIN